MIRYLLNLLTSKKTGANKDQPTETLQPLPGKWIIFSGAGLSQESGLATYRAKDGLWAMACVPLSQHGLGRPFWAHSWRPPVPAPAVPAAPRYPWFDPFPASGRDLFCGDDKGLPLMDTGIPHLTMTMSALTDLPSRLPSTV